MEMLKFTCPSCAGALFFNNFSCLACGTEVNFQAAEARFISVLDSLACQNRNDHSVCNWSTEEGEPFCLSCRANQLIPDLSVQGNLERWSQLEESKRRVLLSFLRLGLPLDGIAFRFVAPTPEEPATTGHCDGVITVNLKEADPVSREAARENLNERLRTVVGHFRHELGHHFWARRIEPDLGALEQFRGLFGDERQDYQASLEQHYSTSATTDTSEHISDYASVHPWEDWAETFAHYLHMRDVLETAGEFSLCADFSGQFDFELGLAEWRRLSVVFNEINRSMGLQDLYPFTITEPVSEKLRFVHRCVESARETLPASIS